MISSHSYKWLPISGVGFFFLALLACAPATAAGQRIVSLNLCFDQLLEDSVTDPSQQLLRTDQHAGSVERILRWQPDLVLANPFSNPLLINALRQHSLTVEILPEPESWAELVNFHQQFVTVTGYGQQRAAAVAETPSGADRLFVGERVLLLQANHYSFASATLWDQLVTRLGAVNAAPGTGLVTVLPEQIIRLDPDYLVVVQGEGFALASRNLLHGALQPMLTERQLSLPAAMFGCIAQQMPAVIEALRQQVEAL